jgi:hypothetical protein
MKEGEIIGACNMHGGGDKFAKRFSRNIWIEETIPSTPRWDESIKMI